MKWMTVLVLLALGLCAGIIWFIDPVMQRLVLMNWEDGSWSESASSWSILLHMWPIAIIGALVSFLISFILSAYTCRMAALADAKDSINHYKQETERFKEIASDAVNAAQIDYAERLDLVKFREQQAFQAIKEAEYLKEQAKQEQTDAQRLVDHLRRQTESAERKAHNATHAAARYRKKTLKTLS